MRYKATTSGDATAKEVREAFLAELPILIIRARAVAGLRSGRLLDGLVKLTGSRGQSPSEVLRLMDEIESNFSIIRRKLGL